MGLFLLGIPCALIGAKILHDDIKYTAMDLRINKASHNLNEQYKQIDNNFVDILQYSGAKCKLKSKGYQNYEIYDIKKGKYGGMEQYLAEKGYYPQAIQYAKNMFDNIAEKEEQIKRSDRSKRIRDFEEGLTNGQMKLFDFNIKYVNVPKAIVELETEKMLNYLHSNGNPNAYCNIIMGDIYEPLVNHREVWHIFAPKNADIAQYLIDISEELNLHKYG